MLSFYQSHKTSVVADPEEANVVMPPILISLTKNVIKNITAKDGLIDFIFFAAPVLTRKEYLKLFHCDNF